MLANTFFLCVQVISPFLTLLPTFTKGIILNGGKIDSDGNREEILTEENLKKAFDIDVKLVKSSSGRLWAVTD